MFEIPDNIIEDALKKAIAALIEKHKELGMEATGQWIDGLEARVGHNSGSIWGEHYTEQLVHGRPPGNRPPITPIERWVKAKFGLSGRQAKSAAFAVANKIAAEGTTWYPQGSDLLEVLEDPYVVSAFYDEVGVYLRLQVSEQLRRDLKELAA